MSQQNDSYVIRGVLTGRRSGRPLAGYHVEALDKDLFRDDKLGSAVTDSEGRFEIRYAAEAFSDLFEKGPDIYLRISNDKKEVVLITEQAVRANAGREEIFQLSLDDSHAVLPTAIPERLQFTHLLATNPNYFGTAGGELQKKFKVVFPQQGDISYEHLHCIGLKPEENLLEGILHIKKPFGYGGGLCTDGSLEYVAFYIDYEDGNGFVSTGPAATVNVHNLKSTSSGEIWYAVRQTFEPKNLESCKKPQVVKLRAILSWEQPPTGPDFKPVWGNKVEAWVQLQPFGRRPKPSLMELDIAETDPGIFKEIYDYTDESLKHWELADKYADRVRGAFMKNVGTNANYHAAIVQGVTKDDVAKAAALLEESNKLTWPKDLKDWVPVQPVNGKTDYEELTCLGLHPEDDLLEATIKVKKEDGYFGNLCTAGTREYVAFYINWGSGFVHVGTDSVRVHDIPGKHKPLMYAVRMPIRDILNHLRNCSDEQVVTVRAILSWHQPPTHAGFNPTWGNVLDRRVQIRPLKAGGIPELYLINDVPVSQINNFTGYATESGIQKPMGGIVGIWGNVNVPGATYYRILFKTSTSAWTPVTDPRTAWDTGGSVQQRRPGTNGWFSISDYLTDSHPSHYLHTALAHWNSSVCEDGLCMLRLELADALRNPMGHAGCTIRLDNTAPSLYKFDIARPYIQGLAVKSGGVLNTCGAFTGDELIGVSGNFSDLHYASYSLSLAAGNIVGSIALTGYAPSLDTGTLPNGDGSSGESLLSFRMRDVNPGAIKCAYVIELVVRDRCISGYLSDYHHKTTSNEIRNFAGFNWE